MDTTTRSPFRVRSVELHDTTLSWICCETEQKETATINEILFILDSCVSIANYVICCLKEDADSSTKPFELLLLATDTIPTHLHQGRLVQGLPSHLQFNSERFVDVVVSTGSGIGRALSFWQSVLRPLLKAVINANDTNDEPCQVIISQDAQSIRKYARTLEKSTTDRSIILLSGDGGVVDLLNGCEERPGPSPPLIALLPLGTGNALFHSLHKTADSDSGPTPLVLGLQTLFLGVSANLPTFRANFSQGSHIVSFTPDTNDENVSRRVTAVSYLYGAIVASYGFHASIVYESDTPEYRVHGSKRFGMVAQELLKESHPYRAELGVCQPQLTSGSSTFQNDPHESHSYVLISMVSNLERTFTISPASRPLDGKLYLVHFGPIGGERTMETMMKAYDGGKHVGLEWEDGEKVRYEEVSGVRIHTLEENSRWRKFCVDGTIVEVPMGGDMTVQKADRVLFQVLVDARVANVG